MSSAQFSEAFQKQSPNKTDSMMTSHALRFSGSVLTLLSRVKLRESFDSI